MSPYIYIPGVSLWARVDHLDDPSVASIIIFDHFIEEIDELGRNFEIPEDMAYLYVNEELDVQKVFERQNGSPTIWASLHSVPSKGEINVNRSVVWHRIRAYSGLFSGLF